MRQILFEIPTVKPGTRPAGEWSGFGFGLVLLLWSIFGAVSATCKLEAVWSGMALIWWAGIAAVIVLLLNFREKPLPRSVSGRCCSFRLGVSAKLVGVDPAFARDLGMIARGCCWCEVFAVAQHHERIFHDCVTLSDACSRVAGWRLTLYGGLSWRMLAFCRAGRTGSIREVRRRGHPGGVCRYRVGRMGCLMNGCCFGDACSLPWAIRFPQGSLPWMHRNFAAF